MTPTEFFELLASGKVPRTVTMPRIPIAVAECDRSAAKLLLWLDDELGEKATEGDLIDVLLSALDWSQFFAAASLVAEEMKKAKSLPPSNST